MSISPPPTGGTAAPPASSSPAATVARLIRKDLYLQRSLYAGALLAGTLALALVASGNAARFYMGCVLLATVLIGYGATTTILSVVEERQQQNLAFIMSLPISVKHYVTAKILGNLLGFAALWSPLLLGALTLILIRDDLPNGLIAYTIIIVGEIVASTSLILTVALITRSLPWTLGIMVLGSLVFNGFIFQIFRTPSFIAAAGSPSAVWSPEALSLLLAELASIVLLLGIAYTLSIRRRDVL